MARSRVGLTIDVDLSGPLFATGQAQAAIRAFLDETKAEVARVGVNEVEAHLGSVLKHPTGHYQSQVITNLAGRFNDRVIYDRVVYGPWLEGTSSRNKTTRFRGYRTFRKVRLMLRKQMIPIAQGNLDRCIQRLGGVR